MKKISLFFAPTLLSLAGFAQEAAAPTAAPAPPVWANFLPFVVILVVFYFFLIRPQSKRQAEQKKFIDGIKVGDQVITQSGILGRVAGLSEGIVNLEIATGVQMKIMKSQILSTQAALQAAAQKSN